MQCNQFDPMCSFYEPEPKVKHTTICHHCDSYPCVCGAQDGNFDMLESTPVQGSTPSQGEYLWSCALNGDAKAQQKYEEYEEQRRLQHMINNRDGRIL